MPYLPPFDPDNFTPGQKVDNRYFPLTPGTIQTFHGETEDQEEANDFFVTYLTDVIAGVKVIVVRDTAYDDGILVEDTLDWFAQDEFGNVWYLGESVNNYRYDDEGEFTGTDHDGAWETGVDGALPGWIMEAAANIGVGDNYYQEHAPGVALDEATVVATGLDFTVDGHTFHNVIKTAESSALDPGIIGYKYYAPNVGLIGVEEYNAEGELEFTSALIGARNLKRSDQRGLDTPETNELTAQTLYLTVDGADTEEVNALGAYTYNLATGVIGEAWIVVAAIDDETSGQFTFELAAGQGLGLFLVPKVDEIGLDLEDYLEGGLHFVNFMTGAPAKIGDGMAPVIVDDEGQFLPLQAFHAVGANAAGYNLLNPGAGINVIEQRERGPEDGIDTFMFDDTRVTDPDYDGDFDDLVVVISTQPFEEEMALLAGPGRSADLPHDRDANAGLDGPHGPRGHGGWDPAAWGHSWAANDHGVSDWWAAA